MKILVQCPYCDTHEFEITKYGDIYCETCGEDIIPEIMNFKKFEEN